MPSTPPRDGEKQSKDPSERLDSWKEIAAYLKRDVATARRWEKREALPIHRHHHEKLGSVYAYASELDAWSAGRRREIDTRANTTRRRQSIVWFTVVAGILVAIAGLAYYFRASPDTATVRPRVKLAVHRPGTVASLIAAGLLDVLNRRLPSIDIEVVQEPGMMSTLRA